MNTKNKSIVWVVEIKEGSVWAPCADAKLTRKDAEREIICYWQPNNRDDTFRVRKYARSAEHRG